ncbi:MAG: type IV pili methyl-accepting chemotaxis transducer N-terminal domain-containing protein [Pseudomonadota bacterium]
MTGRFRGFSRPIGTRLRATITTAILCFVAGTTTSLADTSSQNAATEGQAIANSDGALRINLSGKLRMLSQRITAAGCYVQAGVAPDRTKSMLESASAEFQSIANALEFGDPALGITAAEDKRRPLAALERLNDLFGPFSALAQQINTGSGTPADVAELAAQSAPVLEMAQALVTRVSTAYANPGELLLMDAMAIDIAGRQRMLAQRVSKNVCLLSTGLGTEDTADELRAAAEVFRNSLIALRDGMASSGIRTPPTAEIAEGLETVLADWDLIAPKVETVLAGNAVSVAELAIVFDTANRLTGKMNTLVGLYEAASDMGA